MISNRFHLSVYLVSFRQAKTVDGVQGAVGVAVVGTSMRNGRRQGTNLFNSHLLSAFSAPRARLDPGIPSKQDRWTLCH